MINESGPSNAEMGIDNEGKDLDNHTTPKIKAFYEAMEENEIPADLLKEGQDFASWLRELSPSDLFDYFISDLTIGQKADQALIDKIGEESLQIYNSLIEEHPEADWGTESDAGIQERKEIATQREGIPAENIKAELETSINEREKTKRATSAVNQLVPKVNPKRNPIELAEARDRVFQKVMSEIIDLFDQNGWILPKDYFDPKYHEIFPERIKAMKEIARREKEGTGLM